jgi:beta-1,4-mannosyl-glycoprotein beta-1,4-N-acetylglucosaminyltransferase
MKIYDCFIFNHEVEMLELRLNILNDYVDYFIITEGDITFSGNPKESFYLKNKEKFAKWENKIIHNYVNVPKDFTIPWDREIWSRNSPLNMDIFDDDDVILSSDIDEIPNPEILEEVSSWIKDDSHFTFKQTRYVYYLNNVECQNGNIMDHWFGTRAATYNYMKTTSVDDIREHTEFEDKITGYLITNGGWHFSYCGGEDMIRKKIESFCDLQYQNSEVYDNIKNNMDKNVDLFNRNSFTYKKVDLDDSFPEFIIENKEKYFNWIVE